MSVPARDIAPEVIAEGRRLYEETSMPVESIARLMDLGVRTLYTRRKQWGWKSREWGIRRLPPPDENAAAREIERAEAEAAAVTPRPRAELIVRLVKRVEAEILAVERLIAKSGRAGAAETERAARTLAILVRSLRELTMLEKNEPGGDEDEAERDADAFRRELGDTLERVLAAGEAR